MLKNSEVNKTVSIRQDVDQLDVSRRQACLRHPLGPQQPTITWFAIADD
ncbi:hypothetical protein T10_9865 [Trichinella papuae]|uniref:Uncharacterized protein n=1 Tax=Trichinella papuae TaxID=268474 RepID=A0A0V1M0J8_9BILA|nr:hypothetical protein T10_9865 [Trichinella papuae]